MYLQFELLMNRPFMFALVCYGDILQIGRFSSPSNPDNLDISNKFQILSELQIEALSAETYWNETKGILTSTCENVMGKKNTTA